MWRFLIENWYSLAFGAALIGGFVGSCSSIGRHHVPMTPEAKAKAIADAVAEGWDPQTFEAALARAERAPRYGDI